MLIETKLERKEDWPSDQIGDKVWDYCMHQRSIRIEKSLSEEVNQYIYMPLAIAVSAPWRQTRQQVERNDLC